MSARYARHARIEGFSQADLLAARVGVIGAGAVGNEVVKNLVLLGVGGVDLYDFDRVEIHNLTRSIFLRESDVGAEKAVAVAHRAAEVDPNVRLRAFPGDFWRSLSLSRLAGYRAVICCVDNFEARLQLNQMALITGTLFINAAIDSRHASVEAFPLACPAAACYECHLPASVHDRVAQRYSCGWLRRLAWQERVVPTTAVTASLAGALAAGWALGLGGAAEGARRSLIDSHRGHGSASRLDRVADCPACAGRVGPLSRRAVGARAEAVAAVLQAAPAHATVRLSDPLVTALRCAHCGGAGRADALWRPVRDFDERLTHCPACRAASVQVDIRERYAAGELRDVLATLPGRVLPIKYLLVSDDGPPLCLDLEEQDHVD